MKYVRMNGKTVSTSQVVLDKLKLRHAQNVSTEVGMQVISANAKDGLLEIAMIKQKRMN